MTSWIGRPMCIAIGALATLTACVSAQDVDPVAFPPPPPVAPFVPPPEPGIIPPSAQPVAIPSESSLPPLVLPPVASRVPASFMPNSKAFLSMDPGEAKPGNIEPLPSSTRRLFGDRLRSNRFPRSSITRSSRISTSCRSAWRCKLRHSSIRPRPRTCSEFAAMPFTTCSVPIGRSIFGTSKAISMRPRKRWMGVDRISAIGK